MEERIVYRGKIGEGIGGIYMQAQRDGRSAVVQGRKWCTVCPRALVVVHHAF